MTICSVEMSCESAWNPLATCHAEIQQSHNYEQLQSTLSAV